MLSRESMAKAEAMHPQGQLWADMRGFEGVLLLDHGDHAAAEPLFEEALAEARRTGAKSLEMRMWGNLGFVALQLNHFDDALDRFTRASAIAQALGDRFTLQKCLGNIGWVYYSTGDFQRALLNAQAASTEAEAVGASIDQVEWVRNAGMSQYQTNHLSEARSTFVRALALAEGLHDADTVYQTHVSLAYLLLKLHSPEAELHVQEASRLGSLRPDQRTEATLLETLLLIQQNQPQAAETKLLQLAKNAKAFPSIQWEAENTLANLYANAGRTRDADLWFTRAIATFHQQRLSLKAVELQLPFLENGSSLYTGYMEHLIRTRRTAEALNILDQSRAETLAEGLGTANTAGSTLPTRALAARLHGTILVYCLRPHASFLWAINSAGERFFPLPGSADILPLVSRHTQAILASKDLLTQQDSTGRRLYDALIQPAASMIPPGSRVFLIADKGLGALNFETLIPPPVPNTALHYWIEDIALTNARSLRLLAATHQQAPPRPLRPAIQHMLLFGDPVYRSGDYPPLPNAAAEISGVAAHFPTDQRSVITGPQASPAAYATSDPGSFAYLHFVAHATANETNPLDSAIILSTPPGDNPAPYRLYARDILSRPLHAELVTLSSCYGSGTRNYSGEGVVGLVWAFLRAGAHSVIGAMWEVSDVSTPQLMDTLYTGLLHGDQPDQALRSAKLQMLHGPGIFRKPLYWASFQLYTGR